MDESTSFAIATQQSHALGKSPKEYGTSEARHDAMKKYDTPRDDKKTADPGGLGKEAGWFSRIIKPHVINPIIEDQTRKIVREEMAKNVPQEGPSTKIKIAGIRSVSDLVDGFSDELVKIAIFAPMAGAPATAGAVKAMPHVTSHYTKVPKLKPAENILGPSIQPVSSPPSVRG